jgi:hypothetical protein
MPAFHAPDKIQRQLLHGFGLIGTSGPGNGREGLQCRIKKGNRYVMSTRGAGFLAQKVRKGFNSIVFVYHSETSDSEFLQAADYGPGCVFDR